MMLVDPFRFAGSNPAELEFLGSQLYPSLPATGATWSVSGVDIGEQRADRRIFLLLHVYYNATTNPIISGTVNGHPITVHVQLEGFGGRGVYRCAILSAHVPSGTTADIEIVFSPLAVGWPFLAVYRAIDLQSDVARDAKGAASSGSGSTHYPLSLEVATGGFVIAGATFRATNSSATYIDGVTERYDFEPPISGAPPSYLRHFGGSEMIASDDANYALDCVIVNEFGMPGTFVAASFR